MDFSDPVLWPQYNLPNPSQYCPREYNEDQPPDICVDECQVFVCLYIERDEVHAPGLEVVLDERRENG